MNRSDDFFPSSFDLGSSYQKNDVSTDILVNIIRRKIYLEPGLFFNSFIHAYVWCTVCYAGFAKQISLQ